MKSRSRPAISKLAARRLTSHSQGPGRVSSKSLTSKTRRRSGAAKTPKFERWASPQSWTRKPGTRGLREVHRHDRRRAAVEGEGRGEHPPVADRDEFVDTALGLVLEHLDRVSAGGLPAPSLRDSSEGPSHAPPCRRLRAPRRMASVYWLGFGGLLRAWSRSRQPGEVAACGPSETGSITVLTANGLATGSRDEGRAGFGRFLLQERERGLIGRMPSVGAPVRMPLPVGKILPLDGAGDLAGRSGGAGDVGDVGEILLGGATITVPGQQPKRPQLLVGESTRQQLLLGNRGILQDVMKPGHRSGKESERTWRPA